MTYDLKSVRAPRLAGFQLRAAAALLESSLTKPLLSGKLLRDAGIEAFRRAVLAEAPSVAPRLPHPATLGPTASGFDVAALAAPRPPAPGFHFASVADFSQAYRCGTTTPTAVAERLIEALKSADAAAPPLRAIVAFSGDEIRRQAEQSTERFRQGAPLGPFDGVPVSIKDELDLTPYPTTVGTAFLKSKPDTDSTVAARLRSAGALLFGKANMHEIGIDTSGFNPHHGTPRNPYDPARYTGGSSSGCGSAVGAGLCPVAIGADGGGSIRIPASLCGVVGLKATWGRISEAGAAPLCWSVAHVGPLGATVQDVALAYAVIAGPDPRDPNSRQQPPVHLSTPTVDRLDGVRLGVFSPWFKDAAPAVVSTCEAVLEKLRGLGASVVEVEIPDLELARLAHAITILTEMALGVDPYDAEHRTDYGYGVRLNLALARELNNRDYVRAQQVRTRLSGTFDRLFSTVDAIVTPSTAITAPVIRGDVFPDGESDLDMTSAMMRYEFPANLTGHPAVSVPAGYDADGMPVGLQFMGRPWEENLLLRIGDAVERVVERRAPKIHFPLLGA
jgi:Asp-tRNA(Asn)/Glu-tRNA(Gln) amidotransferase A subunit family amidase